MGEKSRSYYDAERHEMLELIPDGITKTVEFGCGNGNFSKGVKNNFRTESWGVDIDSRSIKNADKVLDKTIKGDAFEALKKLPENYFDLVICNDFLEHIVSPMNFLKALKPFVKKDAYLICSLPNVRHWKNIAELIFEKDWRYKSSGILDDTHLRFFTKKSMLRLLRECNLEVEEIKGISPARSLRFHIPNVLSFGVHNDMKYLQFIIRSKF